VEAAYRIVIRILTVRDGNKREIAGNDEQDGGAFHATSPPSSIRIAVKVSNSHRYAHRHATTTIGETPTRLWLGLWASFMAERKS
jgi:hypothetical protein